jgi:hypothetical protein
MTLQASGFQPYAVNNAVTAIVQNTTDAFSAWLLTSGNGSRSGKTCVAWRLPRYLAASVPGAGWVQDWELAAQARVRKASGRKSLVVPGGWRAHADSALAGLLGAHPAAGSHRRRPELVDGS